MLGPRSSYVNAADDHGPRGFAPAIDFRTLHEVPCEIGPKGCGQILTDGDGDGESRAEGGEEGIAMDFKGQQLSETLGLWILILSFLVAIAVGFAGESMR